MHQAQEPMHTHAVISPVSALQGRLNSPGILRVARAADSLRSCRALSCILRTDMRFSSGIWRRFWMFA